MAPIPDSLSAIHTLFTTLTRRTTATFTTTPSLHARSDTTTTTLHARDEAFPHGSGTIQPTSVPTSAIFALIGIICAGFVITGIWFFFIAKNGGFHFRQGDWEDYKSTVLRRKGPNGTTLSGATRTTDLGGGSVVGKRYRDSESSVLSSAYTEQSESLVGTETVVSEMTSITRGVSGRFQKEKTERSAAASAAKKERKRFREKGDKREKSRLRDAESVGGDELEGDDLGDAAIRSYRHEKPARVGGMNRAADGSAFESSVGGSEESATGLLAGREATPTNSPQKVRRVRERGGEGYAVGSPSASPTKERAGIRKVETVREADRIKAEARRLREKGRSAAGRSGGGRRDFSYTPGDDLGSSVGGSTVSGASGSGSGMPGGYVDSEVSGDTGTKSYRHVIPGLSGTAAAPGKSESYAEERRRRRAER
ncbi:hypothetical protein V499_06514 [Pseudogymnoascus sp. VKM F-103]|nr:hypothetical protein V499_06514 [Pseudogymnoascus sp. VKM F-103]